MSEQRNVQLLEQTQTQRLTLTANQLLQVRLISMPLVELEEAVNAEIADNPALETAEMSDDDVPTETLPSDSDEPQETFEQQMEREEREDALEAALSQIGADDVMDAAYKSSRSREEDTTTGFETGSDVSFYDTLLNQMGEHRLTERQQQVMRYLIGTLDDDGLLRKPLAQIADELAVYEYLDVSESEIEDVLQVLQTFDPPGIGGRTLQECLLLQVRRRREMLRESPLQTSPRGGLQPDAVGDLQSPTNTQQLLLDAMEKVLTHYFDAFIKNQWAKIAAAMHLSDDEAATLSNALRHLNPKPGLSLGESISASSAEVTPDFFVIDDGAGRLSVELNRGQMPELYVSPLFEKMISSARAENRRLNRAEKEALTYSRQKVEQAKAFISAIRQRQITLLTTMKAIVAWQREWFLEGDDSLLRPMILKDIAEGTGLHLSTISRVCRSKWVQTRWGIHPLRHFFSDVYTTDKGQELSKHEIKDVLRSVIEAEDKANPLSDEAIEAAMKAKGYPIARRTVTKYRKQLGLPVARLRKT